MDTAIKGILDGKEQNMFMLSSSKKATAFAISGFALLMSFALDASAQKFAQRNVKVQSRGLASLAPAAQQNQGSRPRLPKSEPNPMLRDLSPAGAPTAHLFREPQSKNSAAESSQGLSGAYRGNPLFQPSDNVLFRF